MNDSTFFVTGGTLPLNASSYVGRQADSDLYNALLKGQYCYLLNTRQMGKSSLVVRTAERLRQDIGASVAIFELSAIGQNITPEQLYYGLCNLLGQQLGLEDEFDEFWFANEMLSPMQRFFESIRKVALATLNGPVIIVVDEVDVLRTVQQRFSTDEFFGGIRDCHNRRATQPDFQRLTFCLVGVATPADLISDTRVSPFNIGQRIVISDFQEEEAKGLAVGLGSRGKELLPRVLYWTGGHPHLTQRLCHELVKQGTTTIEEVDRECERLFLSKTARESDDNLTFVRDRLLRSAEHRVEDMLDLYSRVRQGRPVYDDDANPLHATLRLSGVAKVADNRGRFIVRNRIYERVFDGDFVRDNMPDAELRRQETAARRGRIQVGAVAIAVILTLTGMLRFTLEAKQQAQFEADRANSEAHRANVEAQNSADALKRFARVNGDLDKTRRQLELYNREIATAQKQLNLAKSQINITQKQRAESIAVAQSKLNKAKALLLQWEKQLQAADHTAAQLRHDANIARADVEDARRDATEARRIAVTEQQNAQQAKLATVEALQAAKDARNEVENANRLAKSTRETLEKENTELSREKDRLSRVIEQQRYVYSIANALSELESNEIDRALRVLRPIRSFYEQPKFEWAYLNTLANIPEMKKTSFPRLLGGISALAFSRNGEGLIASNKSTLYDERTHQIFSLSDDGMRFRTVAISPNGSFFGTGDNKGRIRLWRINRSTIDEESPAKAVAGGVSAISALGFSGGESPLLIAGTSAGKVTIWNRNKKMVREILLDKSVRNIIRGVALDAEGQRAVVATDSHVGIYSVETGKPVTVLKDVPSISGGIAFFPGGGKVALTTRDNQLYIFDAVDGSWLDGQTIPAEVKDPQTIVFSSQGTKVAIGGNSSTVAEMQLKNPDPVQQPSPVRSVSFTPDSRGLVLINEKIENAAPLVLPKSLEVYPTPFDRTRQFGTCNAFSPNGQYFAVGTQQGEVEFFSTKSASSVPKLLSTVPVGITNLSFSPDGTQIAAGHTNGMVTIWQLTSGASVNLSLGTDRIAMLAFTPDGNKILVGSSKNGVGIFSTDGKLLRNIPLERSNGDSQSMSLSPNGQTIAIAQGNTIRIYEIATGQTTVCRGHTNLVSCLAFSPDSSRAVTGGHDGTVKLWDVSTGQQVLTLRGSRYWNDSGFVTSVAFARDGKAIAVGTESGKAIILRATAED